MTIFSRRRALLEALCLSALAWGMIAAALWLRTPAAWPWERPRALGGRGREDLALFVLIIQFLMIKTYLMFARTRYRSSLGLSLISVNAAFIVTYLVGAFLPSFWPAVARPDVVQPLRLLLLIALAWASVELTRSEDAEEGVESPWVLVDALRVQRDALLLEVRALEARLIVSQRSEIASLHAQIDAEGRSPA